MIIYKDLYLKFDVLLLSIKQNRGRSFDVLLEQIHPLFY